MGLVHIKYTLCTVHVNDNCITVYYRITMFLAEDWKWELWFRLYKDLDSLFRLGYGLAGWIVCRVIWWSSAANHLSRSWWSWRCWTFSSVDASPERRFGSHNSCGASWPCCRMQRCPWQGTVHGYYPNPIMQLKNNLITAELFHKY